MRQVRAGEVEPHRLRAGGEQERVVAKQAAVRELDVPGYRVDHRHRRAEPQVDVTLAVELRRPERDGLLGSRTREEAFRQLGPVAGQRRVGAEHRDAAGVTLVSKRLGRRVARAATADDDDGGWHGGRHRLW